MTECHTYQKGGPFEKQDLVGLNDLSKVAQVGLELLHIWDQLIDNAGPCLHTIANQPQRHNGCGHLRPNVSCSLIFVSYESISKQHVIHPKVWFWNNIQLVKQQKKEHKGLLRHYADKDYSCFDQTTFIYIHSMLTKSIYIS